jgi:tripartite-type tricarboxylate transporter receptor subunit TctC
VAAAGAAVLCGAARAQGWPTKPVTMIVPFPAGGGTDAFARPLSGQFTKVAGQTLVIDNRGGAGGTLGASIAAKAPADGYTLFMGAVHHAIAPSVYPKLDYDIEKDFVPLMLLANVPQVVVINPKRVQANTIQEFIALVKRNPGKFNYGSAGSGTSHHLAGELFKLQTGTFITHIPYRGAGPALSDLISGNVDLMFDGLGSSAQHIKSGRIKALMVAGSKRNPRIPRRAVRRRSGPARLHRHHLVRPLGAEGHAGRSAGACGRRHEEGACHRRAQDHLGAERLGDPDPHHGGLRRLRELGNQALGHGREGLGRQARMTAAGTVSLHREGAVAVVTLSNAGRLNAMTRAMWRELRAVFDGIAWTMPAFDAS